MSEKPVRPNKLPEKPVPPLPQVDPVDHDVASVQYSHYRTGLSNHRTGLSEHRTQLSEYRTDLSGERTEMSMRRTGMSFQRTRMSADRTLMSVLRTSLSLIGFGFTIFQFFAKLAEADVLKGAQHGPRNLGLALVLLGVAMLIAGIVYHLQFMLALRKEREAMRAAGLLHAESPFPTSLTLIVALILFAIGVAAIFNMIY